MTNKTENMKEYMKKYYEEHKETLLKKMLQKEECPLCGRQVNHQRMPIHNKSKYCLKRRKTELDNTQ